MQGTIEPLVLEEHQCEVVADPSLPPLQVHVCSVFFENIIFCPCSIYVTRFLLLSKFYIYYFIHDSIEALVLEEHQIDDPPIRSQQVRLCFAFFENIIFRQVVYMSKILFVI